MKFKKGMMLWWPDYSIMTIVLNDDDKYLKLGERNGATMKFFNEVPRSSYVNALVRGECRIIWKKNGR